MQTWFRGIAAFLLFLVQVHIRLYTQSSTLTGIQTHDLCIINRTFHAPEML